MKWLMQSIRLQFSVISAYLSFHKEIDARLINLFVIGNIFFVLLHPESVSLGILGAILAWKFYKTGNLTRF